MARKAKKRRSSRDKVLNDRPRKVFRHRIGNAEVIFSVFFIAFTLGMGLWFVLQRNNYNPGDRDISMDVLLAQQVEDNLWETPLQRWVEPGSEAATAGGPSVDLAIYPASTLSDGWTDASRVEIFDENDLYKKIDGQETQYKAYGFQKLYFLAIAYAPEDLEVNVELYDMGSFQNALGVFAAQRSADSKVEKHGSAYLYLTEVGALGIVDKYYFKFTGNASNPRIQDHALKVVQDFASGIEGGGSMPKGFAILADDFGIDFGNIEYKPEDVFQFSFAKDFWFGKPSADSNMRYFIHEAASEADAADLLEKILEEQQWDYTLVSRDGNKVVLKHDFLKTYFTINQSGVYVFGVEQAPDQAEASQSLEDLAAKLFDTIA